MFIWDFFRPVSPDRRGTELSAESVAIGTGGRLATASATVSYVVPLPRRKVTIKSINVTATVAAAGGGAITVQAFKVSTGGGAQAITAATSLTNSFLTAVGTFALPLSSGLADGKRLIDGGAGDYVRLDIVAASTVTTQPTADVVVEYGFCE